MNQIIQAIDRFFKIKERKSTLTTEILAGLTTFLTMAYILAVNAVLLSNAFGAGMESKAIFIATALAAGLTTIMMGLYANLPIALAPGMGVNAFFSFTVAGALGFTPAQALGAVFISGLIYLVIAFTGIRQKVIQAIPTSLKHAIGAGIGFFIAFIGLKNAGIIVSDGATFVTLAKFSDPLVLLSLIGLGITLALLALKIHGAVFFGLASTAILGLVFHAYVFPEVAALPSYAGWWSFDLSFTYVGAALTDLGSVLTSAEGWIVIFTFLFIDFFDTAGTLVAIGNQSSLVTPETGELENSGKANIVDATGTVVGSLLGTSTVTSYIESSAGIGVGGRTGLTAVIVGVLFLLSTMFSPLLSVVTSQVTAPALIVVGSLMASSLAKIKWEDWPIAVSAFVTIIIMILSYSISEGIAAGFLIYSLVMVASKRWKEVHPILLAVDVWFILHFILRG